MGSGEVLMGSMVGAAKTVSAKERETTLPRAMAKAVVVGGANIVFGVVCDRCAGG